MKILLWTYGAIFAVPLVALLFLAISPSEPAPDFSEDKFDLSDPVAMERFRKKNERDSQRAKDNYLRQLTPAQKKVWDYENEMILKGETKSTPEYERLLREAENSR